MKKLLIKKSIISVIIFSLIFLLFACSKKEAPAEKPPQVRPVKTLVIQSQGIMGKRIFPGVVDSNKKANLSFRVSGKIIELPVKEGMEVKKGDLIAKLDPTDFQLAVNDKNAQFTRAKKDYLRAKKLVKDGHISKLDFDRLESVYLSSRAALKLAQQQLDYTSLKAPFDGIIAKRFVQNFEEVQVKQDIVSLNDNSELEVKFNIPENLILSMNQDIPEEMSDEEKVQKMSEHVPVTATFNVKNSKKYALSFKESTTKADAKTQTFQMTYILPKPEDIILLPGMTASVEVDMSYYQTKAPQTFEVPVSAVVADSELKGRVWVVDEKTMQVHPKRVTVGEMKGNTIKITSGLQAGQRIVIAGVPFLYEGLKVRLMKQTEQAIDRIPHQRPQNCSAVKVSTKMEPRGDKRS